MLIDKLAPESIDVLYGRALDSRAHLYLMFDGAFMNGAHRVFDDKEKSILFETLPCCTDATREVSPFVVAFDPTDRRQRVLFERCSGWPMVSAIETPESLVALSTRLAGWCVIEVDNQRFNFRFPDTRRLPAIFKTLTPEQRTTFTGPMKRWSYIARDGKWLDLPMSGDSGESAAVSTLDERQFASLVDDSRADELLVLLRDRGHDVYRLPSRSYFLVKTALQAASAAALVEEEVLQWCAWFWELDECDDNAAAASLLQSWKKDAL